MSRALMIFEIPGKQRYIFGSKALKDNVERSQDIAYLMNEFEGQDFFQDLAREQEPGEAARFYDRARNLVYAGGGHTILQFEGDTRSAAREKARAFGKVVTWEAMRRYHGVELFTKIIDYDENAAPGENLCRLHRELEQKKTRRQAAFRRTVLGVERLGAEIADGERRQEQRYRRKDLSFRPVPQVRPSDGKPPKPKRDKFPYGIEPPTGFGFPLAFEDLADSGGLIAVVHIDGNGMGNRSNVLNHRQDAENWETFCQLRQRFSESVKESYRAAFLHTMDAVRSATDVDTARRMKVEPLENSGKTELPAIPIRPVILAGDDVCFVTAGDLGLDCARVFLEYLAHDAKNDVDEQPYPACAGVVLVHKNYPFHRAYNLAEELCSNAKKYGSSLDSQGRVSAMDWHIEFGQLKDDLEAQRRDYITEDGNCLELRPVTVCAPDGVSLNDEQRLRTWAFFRAMCRTMQEERTARGKIKGLRNALKQGETEAAFYLRMNRAEGLLDNSLKSLYTTDEEKAALFRKIFYEGAPARLPAFAYTGDPVSKEDAEAGKPQKKRSLLFDSIEMLDHCRFLEEG